MEGPMRTSARLIPSALAALLAACGPSDSGASGAPGTGAPAASGAVAAESAPVLGSAPPAADGPIAVDDWVQVVADGVNLRNDPSASAPSQGHGVGGSEALVAAGPIEAEGYAWYMLDAVSLTDAAGDCSALPSGMQCPTAFGWVAGAGPEGEPWLARAELECPPPPTTVTELLDVQAGHNLPCFGGQQLTLRGFLSPESPGRGCLVGDWTVTPAFLNLCPVQFLQATETPMQGEGLEMVIHVHEDIGACEFGGFAPETCALVPFIGQWVEVDGMYDHPDAATCVADATSRDAPHPQAVVYHCRSLFVVTAVRPAG
jgi:hypothetical protein